MAKDIPYFKFYINEWINGDITLEEMEIQGVFINVCAYYWSKDCDLSVTNLKKRFRGYENQIDYLINSSIIKVYNENIIIDFLNDQLMSSLWMAQDTIEVLVLVAKLQKKALIEGIFLE